MEVRKYFLFLKLSPVKADPSHTHSVGAVLVKYRELCPRGREENCLCERTPEKTPCVVHATISPMTAKLGGKYVFLNPRIHPVQWHAHTRRMPGGLWGHSNSQPHFPWFWGIGSLRGLESEISVLICISIQMISPSAQRLSHTYSNAGKLKTQGRHLPDTVTGLFKKNILIHWGGA